MSLKEMIITIKTANGQEPDIDVHCQSNQDIRRLKLTLQKIYPGNPLPSEQRLIYGGKQLLDHFLLKDVLVQSQPDLTQVIHLIVRKSDTNRGSIHKTVSSPETTRASSSKIVPQSPPTSRPSPPPARKEENDNSPKLSAAALAAAKRILPNIQHSQSIPVSSSPIVDLSDQQTNNNNTNNSPTTCTPASSSSTSNTNTIPTTKGSPIIKKSPITTHMTGQSATSLPNLSQDPVASSTSTENDSSINLSHPDSSTPSLKQQQQPVLSDQQILENKIYYEQYISHLRHLHDQHVHQIQQGYQGNFFHPTYQSQLREITHYYQYLADTAHYQHHLQLQSTSLQQQHHHHQQHRPEFARSYSVTSEMSSGMYSMSSASISSMSSMNQMPITPFSSQADLLTGSMDEVAEARPGTTAAATASSSNAVSSTPEDDIAAPQVEEALFNNTGADDIDEYNDDEAFMDRPREESQLTLFLKWVLLVFTFSQNAPTRKIVAMSVGAFIAFLYQTDRLPFINNFFRPQPETPENPITDENAEPAETTTTTATTATTVETSEVNNETEPLLTSASSTHVGTSTDATTTTRNSNDSSSSSSPTNGGGDSNNIRRRMQ